MDTTADEVIEFAERAGQPMAPWQRELTRALFASPRPVLQAGGRRNGRTAHMRVLAEFAAYKGGHVHACHHDGEWCVTRHPVGYLYARVR